MQVPAQSTGEKSALSTRFGASLVAFIAILIRIGMWLVYQPVSYGDSPSYRRAAQAVLDGFVSYDGTRTPGYPIFMAILGADKNIWIAQMLLGVGISLLTFYIANDLTRQPLFAVVAGLAHTFNLGQLFFEADLLTETLTTFWIILTVAGVTRWILHVEKRSISFAVGLGFSTSFALMTRPLFIFLPFWVLVFLLIEYWRRESLWHSLGFLFPVLLIAGSWVGFIQSRYGDWSLTTMSGYHLIQHTGGYFEYVPDQYAALRDTYLEYRDQHISQYGTQTNTIWDAIPAMQEASGLNFYDLSRTLAKISLRLILEHPILYLKNVVSGWWLFWLAPVYWSSLDLHFRSLTIILEPLIVIQRSLLIIVNGIFILTSISMLVAYKRLTLPKNQRYLILFWAGMIWITSIFQTLLDHGDNPRFLVPLQSLVVLWVLWLAWTIIQKQPMISWKKDPGSTLQHTSPKVSKG